MKTSTILICSLLSAAVLTAKSGPAPSNSQQCYSVTGYATYFTIKSCQREGTSGVLTASGRNYDEQSATIALPFHPPIVNNRRQWGKRYRITNLQTGKSIIARHWDYGPGKRARARGVVVDLSPMVFKAIGGELRQGRIKVKVEEI